MQKKIYRRGMTKGILFVAAGMTAGILLTVGHYLKKMLEENTFHLLYNVGEQQRSDLYQEIHSGIGTLKNISLVFPSGLIDTDMQSAAEFLGTVQRNTVFERLIVTGRDGRGINQNMQMENLSESDNVLRAMTGVDAVGAKASLVSVSVPIADEQGGIRGVLTGVYSETLMRDLLSFSCLGEGESYLIDGSGNCILSSSETSVFPLKGREAEAAALAAQEKSGEVNLRFEGSSWHCYYTPTGVSDWYVLVAIRQRGANPFAVSVIGILMFVLVTFIFLGFYMMGVLFRLRLRHVSELEQLACYDTLCGCSNLRKFQQDAQRVIGANRKKQFWMVKMDVDGFRLINRRLGEEAGNKVLIHMATVLREITGKNNPLFARAHDDIFYALIERSGQNTLKPITVQVNHRFRQLIGVDFPLPVNFIYGYCIVGENICSSADEAVERANAAHRKAKQDSIGICMYNDSLVEEALRKKEIEERMEEALENQEYQVYFQPRYDMNDGHMIGAEALARWRGRNGQIIFPGEFIPIFEENSFVIRLDLYMYEQVCRILRQWREGGISLLPVSVNFSRNHLTDPDFVDTLCRIADQYEVPRKLLEVELTERVISQNEEVSLKILATMHERGFTLVMDDFGTGYSSLGLLKNVPVDVIKIDKSFIEGAEHQQRAKIILKNVLRLAGELKTYTIAEGVETEEAAALLRELGCNAVQGYYYAKPVCAEKFKEILAGNH